MKATFSVSNSNVRRRTNRRGRHGSSVSVPPRRTRRGSSLMIVMVLMGMLSLLGVIFYTFAAQERSNATNYAEAAKAVGPSSLTADVLFDWALEQLIVATDPRLTNSMLWGSRHSMLSNELGFGLNRPGDYHPYNGEGVNVIYDTNGNLAVDQNRDGVADTGLAGKTIGGVFVPNILNIVDSPAANNLNPASVTLNEDTNGNWVLDAGEDKNQNGLLDRYPQTDVGYTYPDINNLFVAYVGKVRDSSGNIHRVIKPSFLLPATLRTPNPTGTPTVPRPLIFEDTNLNGILDSGEDTNGNGILDDWCVNPNFAARVMRAHPGHLYVPPSTSTTNTVVSRYLNESEAISLIGPTAHGFPFHPMDPTYNTNAGGAGIVYNFGRLGPFSLLDTSGANPANEPIELDWDNDLDGFREAFLMDLDFPVQQDANGKLFVPMFLITIHDMDSLINLNAHGNLSKILYGPADIGNVATTPVASSTNFPFGYDTNLAGFDWISKSNLGLGPAEINPAWVLNARPPQTANGNPGDGTGAGFAPHIQFFGGDPRNNIPTPQWGETANMELFWAKVGRPIYSGTTITDLAAGVYGEENLLYNAINGGTVSAPGGHTLPRPGYSLADDNNDIQEGQTNPSQNVYFTVTTWDFQHPLDFTGQGSYLNPASPKLINWNVLGSSQWIKYNHYENSSFSTTGSYVRWGQTTGLMTNSLTQGLGDDPYETIFYPTTPAQGATDNLLDPSENTTLQLSNTELNRLSLSTRLTSLVPFNFSKTATENARGESIRHKFTTESNDRKNFGLPTSLRSMGTMLNAATGYPIGQEYSQDNAPYVGPPAQSYEVQPQYNTYRFPPEFSNYVTNPTSPTYIRRYQTFQTGGTPADPFRPYTRALLESDSPYLAGQSQVYAQSVASIQQRLSVNKLLTTDPVTGNYVFRNLTPHPDDPGTTVVGGAAAGTYAYPPTSASGEEYWARLDRQQLCRDIYVLLYLLGHGNDTVNTAMTSNLNGTNPTPMTNGSTIVYSEPQLREMAQFAVNLVDAMDRDSVITRFEYDKDLSDGWNLDDDATTNEYAANVYTVGSANYNANYLNDSAARGEVFGVENLDLTINEALFINTVALTPTNASNQNPSATPFNDGTSRNFAYVEVVNRSPQTVTFGATQAWQIVLKQDQSAMPAVPGFERRLTLGSGSGSITSGGMFTVGSADFDSGGGSPGRSTFKVDPTGGSSYVNIAATSTIASPAGLDLIDEADNNLIVAGGKESIQDANGADMSATKGAWANGFGGNAPPSNTLRVILRRRANPNRAVPAGWPTNAMYNNDNPWIDVDATQITVKTFSLADTGMAGSGATAMNIQTQLQNLTSQERPQPLDRGNEGNHAAGTTPNFVSNSLLAANSNVVSPATIWQPHFDREFASIGELFLIPVFAPYQLTMASRSAQFDSPEKQVATATVGSNDWPFEAGGSGTANSLSAKTAAAKFMVPEDPSNFASASPARYLDNRWHRILEFLEVPTRTNSNLGLGLDVKIPRVPGKMNPNMQRFPDNHAAMLDEGKVAMLNLSPSAVPPDLTTDPIATIDDQLGDMSRDWWQQFAMGRDGFDPYWNSASGVQVPLPGTPAWPSASQHGARPFRSLGDVRYNTISGVQHASIEDTMLRSLWNDQTTYPDPVVVATGTRRRMLEIGLPADHASGTVDPLIRHRLLSKVWGNTTPRSHCFAVFISVKYFSAANQNGSIRIGGPYNGTPAPEHRGFFVVDRSKIEQGRSATTSGYDFRAFVDYRKTLATQ